MITAFEIKKWTESLLRERKDFWSRREADAPIIFVLVSLHNTSVCSCFERIAGGPGVGKGTQCARLAQELDSQYLSVRDL